MLPRSELLNFKETKNNSKSPIKQNTNVLMAIVYYIYFTSFYIQYFKEHHSTSDLNVSHRHNSGSSTDKETQ